MKPRVLLLTHRVPYPPDRGDRIRCWHLLQQLAKSADVSLAATADEPIAPETRDKLDFHCEQVCLVRLPRWKRLSAAAAALTTGTSISEAAFHSRALAGVIDNWHRQNAFDAVVVYCSSMFPYVERWSDVPKLVDLIDVDSAKWQSYAESAGIVKRRLFAREAKLVARLERRIVASEAAIALTTAREASLLRRSCPQAEPLVVTNGVDCDYFRTRQPSTPGRIVFTGVLNYHPNMQGILWFVQQVWPRLLQACPSMTLEIVGRSPTAAIRRLNGKSNIAVVADVPDVRPYLAQAEIIIAPLHIARGIQNKALEAMAMQRAVVVSPAVASGLSAKPREHFLVADDAPQWVEQLTKLHRHEELRDRIAAQARRYVETHHHWTTCLAPITRWLEAATASAAVRNQPTGSLSCP
jgi:sugar transferase (PEP-CTERM/EpsH1 system associated)